MDNLPLIRKRRPISVSAMTPTKILLNLDETSPLRAEAFVALRGMLRRIARIDTSMGLAMCAGLIGSRGRQIWEVRSGMGAWT
jgi:hypothetical protein